MTLLEAAENLLSRVALQYGNPRFDQTFCTSCGAKRSDDYDEDRHTVKLEPCSRTCPWRLLREAVQIVRTDEGSH